MKTSLFDVSVTAVVAACMAGALTCVGTSELIQPGSMNRWPGLTSADRPDPGMTMTKNQGETPSTMGTFDHRVGANGVEGHLQVRTDASARFELQMDLTVELPRYREAVEALAPDDGLHAMNGSGTLMIASTANTPLAGGTVRIRNIETQQEMIYLLALDEHLLEVTLDPGTYDILIEGIITDTAGTEPQTSPMTMQPAPAGAFMLAGLFRVRRRRRR